MRKDAWKVKYTGEELLAGAKEKLAFHQGRREFWVGKKNEVIEKIKAEGITVTESLVDELGKIGYANTRSYNDAGPRVQIDVALAAKVQEAAGKVHEHDAKIRAYSGWVLQLENSRDSKFQLDHEDWLFFFGK